jgi:hypothetical protein
MLAATAKASALPKTERRDRNGEQNEPRLGGQLRPGVREKAIEMYMHQM